MLLQQEAIEKEEKCILHLGRIWKDISFRLNTPVSHKLSFSRARFFFFHSLQKPDNLGFDTDGVVKLFDFGLAKELKDSMRNEDDSSLYNLTGLTGAIRCELQ